MVSKGYLKVYVTTRLVAETTMAILEYTRIAIRGEFLQGW
jgi:hypothetical protein